MLFVEYSSADDGKEYADLSITQTIRRLEAMDDLGRGITEYKHKLLIIGVVGEGRAQDKQACLEAGMDMCIEMPIQRQAVSEAMELLSSHEKEASAYVSPQASAAPMSSAPAAKRVDATTPQAAGGPRKLRVLVVDDDHGQRTLLKTMLQKIGFQVDTAEDGVEAVKAVDRVLYDVVLMDGFMPNKTGWDATIQIRAEEAARADGRKVIIIGVTGATSKEDEEKCFASGMTDVISKPVKRDALNAKIEKWCSTENNNDASVGDGLAAAASAAAGNAGITRTASKEELVIILNTDRTQQIVLKGVFTKAGYKPVFCDSKESMLDKIIELTVGPIRAILVDTSVPGLDVIDTLDQVRKKVDGASADVMPVFAIATSEETGKMKLIGFSDVLAKPAKAETVKKTVLEHLAGGKEGHSAQVAVHRPVAVSPAAGGPQEVRVLIVEDHWANRRLLEAMLKKLGPFYTMEAVENGLEAVNITSSRHYDIVLMDCNMPIMDGWYVLAASLVTHLACLQQRGARSVGPELYLTVIEYV